jgi:hypothetical protein
VTITLGGVTITTRPACSGATSGGGMSKKKMARWVERILPKVAPDLVR